LEYIVMPHYKSEAFYLKINIDNKDVQRVKKV